MIFSLFSRKAKANEAITTALYDQIVAAARQPRFYAEFELPDTPLGRYEMLSLHMFLFMHRLKGCEGKGADSLRDIGQDITDYFFQDVDHSLRELGIGDQGVPKRMKKLARMFYGRVESYDAAIAAQDQPALEAALARNIRPDIENWGGVVPVAYYVFDAVRLLAKLDDAEIAAGRIVFPDIAEQKVSENTHKQEIIADET
ncbi:MAG: ubiquinol-cytochrome C chaperone family protein [Phyllobacterium sp.]